MLIDNNIQKLESKRHYFSDKKSIILTSFVKHFAFKFTKKFYHFFVHINFMEKWREIET